MCDGATVCQEISSQQNKNIGHCVWCDLSDGGLWGVAAKVVFLFHPDKLRDSARYQFRSGKNPIVEKNGSRKHLI
jgi:hypothetical protein